MRWSSGQISQTGLRTVTGMLVGARLSGVWHHARAHRFFTNARWSADELGLRLAELIVERFCDPPGAAMLVAVDDTLLKRLGRKIHVCFWHHDATANSEKAAVAWGNNWVMVGISSSCRSLRAPCVCRSSSGCGNHAARVREAANPTLSGPESPKWQGT